MIKKSFGLIDGAICLLLAVAFIGGATSVVRSRILQSDVAQELEAVSVMMKAANQLMEPGSFVSPERLLEKMRERGLSGDLPSSWQGTPPRDAWGRVVQFNLYEGIVDATEQFSISVSGISKEACAGLVSKTNFTFYQGVSVSSLRDGHVLEDAFDVMDVERGRAEKMIGLLKNSCRNDSTITWGATTWGGSPYIGGGL